jgi:hypothetical protein
MSFEKTSAHELSELIKQGHTIIDVRAPSPV